MKKKFLYILFCATFFNIVVNVNIYSQPIIGNNHVPVFGDQLRLHDVDTTGITQGNSGANQSWNYSGINVLTDSAVFNWVNPSTTPYALSFPTADIAEGNQVGYIHSQEGI